MPHPSGAHAGHPATLPWRLAAALALTVLAATFPTGAQPPPGYYATADASAAHTLRRTLHDIIDDHERTPYSADRSWLLLEEADQYLPDPTRILDVYKNATYPKVGGGTGGYQREHTWPQSYGFPKDGGTGKYPRSDFHAIFLADGSYNGSRGSTLYRTCDHPDCAERPTDVNLGRGGGTGVYPGNSNWRRGIRETGTWETWIGRRGDLARAVLYMDLRYDGSDHQDGSDEPNLVLTNDPFLIVSDGDENQDPAFMGILSDILRWHSQDPVDDLERRRHEVIAAAQGNRNPFVDRPEWADCVYRAVCEPDTALLLGGGRFKVTLYWHAPRAGSGVGHAAVLTADSGYFWFFRDTNVEVILKLLDGCPVNQRFWVFAAGLTNVGVDLRVEDTLRGVSVTYHSPAGTPFQPLQDTGAFATCP